MKKKVLITGSSGLVGFDQAKAEQAYEYAKDIVRFVEEKVPHPSTL